MRAVAPREVGEPREAVGAQEEPHRQEGQHERDVDDAHQQAVAVHQRRGRDHGAHQRGRVQHRDRHTQRETVQRRNVGEKVGNEGGGDDADGAVHHQHDHVHPWHVLAPAVHEGPDAEDGEVAEHAQHRQHVHAGEQVVPVEEVQRVVLRVGLVLLRVEAAQRGEDVEHVDGGQHQQRHHQDVLLAHDQKVTHLKVPRLGGQLPQLAKGVDQVVDARHDAVVPAAPLLQQPVRRRLDVIVKIGVRHVARFLVRGHCVQVAPKGHVLGEGQVGVEDARIHRIPVDHLEEGIQKGVLQHVLRAHHLAGPAQDELEAHKALTGLHVVAHAGAELVRLHLALQVLHQRGAAAEPLHTLKARDGHVVRVLVHVVDEAG
mmetsp:Transcript_13556/g.34183  ORF Transcript_13556/g.34183 Transcript_13556/m.34183 type:complete len:373 (+) Transcript_13556:495-1613(+)